MLVRKVSSDRFKEIIKTLNPNVVKRLEFYENDIHKYLRVDYTTKFDTVTRVMTSLDAVEYVKSILPELKKTFQVTYRDNGPTLESNLWKQYFELKKSDPTEAYRFKEEMNLGTKYYSKEKNFDHGKVEHYGRRFYSSISQTFES